MAQAVSNDALWEKLSEIDKKLDKLSIQQKSSVPKEESKEIKADFNEIKEGIIAEIKEQVSKLGRHNDSHFEAHRTNFQVLIENSTKVLNIVSRIRKQQRETAELQPESKEGYFNFKFFKAKKTFIVIAILGLLVFLLTLFCMKQQNDYSILNSKYYRQHITIQEIRVELDSIRSGNIQKVEKRKTK